jgi:hypothetical protein
VERVLDWQQRFGRLLKASEGLKEPHELLRKGSRVLGNGGGVEAGSSEGRIFDRFISSTRELYFFALFEYLFDIFLDLNKMFKITSFYSKISYSVLAEESSYFYFE